MVEPRTELTVKLLELIQSTGYPIIQHNGQRKFGPPPNWSGPPPPKGCEVFVGKLPREVYEDELVPLFSGAGKIYEMRLMMDFSGSNRGYAFVTYCSRAEAAEAVRQLNGYEIRKGRNIGVVKSVDNCRLFVGKVPKNKSKEEVLEELRQHVSGIVDVILYKNSYDRRLNRGFAFVEFTSHRAAAMARRALVPGSVKLWDQDVNVDWAEPEPDVDEVMMNKVKVLYVRNFLISTTPETIQAMFENAIGHKIERIKKIYDYAFVHFHERAHAELAMSVMQNADVDGVNIEVKWAKPVDRELYRIQKLNRGNAKFNNGFDLSQTLLLYKQHLNKREYVYSPKEDEGIGSVCAGESPCESPLDPKMMDYPYFTHIDYSMAPSKLESMCKRYNWAPPSYEYQKLQDAGCRELWVCRVELPLVGSPLLSTPRRIGPLASRVCSAKQEAHVAAAEYALHCIKILRTSLIQQSTVSRVPPPTTMPTPLATPLPAPLATQVTNPMNTHLATQPMYSTLYSPLQLGISIPYDYATLFTRPPPPTPFAMSPLWRAV